MQFSTYSVRCINNEILMFIRKGTKYLHDISLEMPLGTDKEGNESYKIIRNIVSNLSDRDKDIIIKLFGFNNDNSMTQKEIADELGLSQSSVS